MIMNNLVKDKQSEILKTYDDLDHLAAFYLFRVEKPPPVKRKTYFL